LSLRFKLLLSASLLLLVPVAGYRFVTEVEGYLRERQSQGALDAARTLATALESRPELLPGSVEPDAHGESDLLVHPLSAPLEIDGYHGDWADLAAPANAGASSVIAARHAGMLYLLVDVPSPPPAAPPGAAVARVRLVSWDSPRFPRAWLLEASTPGPLVVREVPPGPGAVGPGHVDGRLRAAARLFGGGARFELRIPMPLLGSRLHLEALDRHRTPNVMRRIPRSGDWRLRLPPAGLDTLVASLAPGDGRRVRVTDAGGRILAQAGALPAPATVGGLRGIVERALHADADRLLARTPATLALSGEEMDSALAGVALVRLRRTRPDGPLVVSAAYPLRVGERVIGAMVLEESTSPIDALGRRALVELFLAAAASFAVASIVLLAVAGRTVARLRELRDRAASAIDATGRVSGDFPVVAGRDEIADLGRSFHAAVSRLAGYQDYLEQLARRLSHELRTPLAVIRSSVDALSMRPGGAGSDAQPFVDRARHGVERLDELIRRMSEATRLEQAIADSELSGVDLVGLARSVVEAQQAQWARTTLRARVPEAPLTVVASADLLLQALDKLLANARDFAHPQTTVWLCVQAGPDTARIWVENEGPVLPAGGHATLFESMVSHRGGDSSGQVGDPASPHLGLGLYVVRLVAEFHGGRPFAENLPHGDGVRIGLELPLAQAHR
jgi:signal transduction histidine kinase